MDSRGLCEGIGHPVGEAQRTMLVMAHAGRRHQAIDTARVAVGRLLDAGVTVRVVDREADAIGCPGVSVVPADTSAADGAELVLVLGGDGSLLRAAELARPSRTPIIGVNLGHVGFLAEAEREDLTETVASVVARDYTVEERMTVDVTVRSNGTVVAEHWALNEATVEKDARDRMLELVVEIDGRPLSRWAGDGVVCATPTGSTAYAFSAGGPVVWPEVEAMMVVPLSAHALFSRPLVVSPRSVVAVELLQKTPGGVLWCDGRRTVDLPPGARVEVRRGVRPVRLARLHRAPFTDRLVAKFGLSVVGWRGRRDVRAPEETGGTGRPADPRGER